MTRRTYLAALCLTLIASCCASAHEFQYSALLSGPAESPPNASAGTGIAVVTLDLDVITMRVEVSFSNLTGTVTASHIHAPTLVAGTGTAGVATQVPSFPGFPLGVTAGSFDQTFDLTVASSYNPDFITSSGGTVSDALNALIFGLADGKAYFNIHTTAFPGGEIRGFLVAVPEPSTLMLCAVGGMGAGIFYIIRYRRRVSRR